MKSIDRRRFQMKDHSKDGAFLRPYMCRILTTIVAVFLLSALASPPLEAKTRTEKGHISFPLEVGLDANGNKRWIILPLIDISQVHVNDEEARTILFNSANGLLTSRVSPEVQKQGRWSFSELLDMYTGALKTSIKTKNLNILFFDVPISRFDTVAESLEVGAKETLDYPVEISLKGIKLRSLNMIFKIGDEEDKDGEFTSTTLGTLGELSTDVISEPLEAKTVLSMSTSIQFTGNEIDKLKPKLARIAVQILNHAKAEPYGMTFGATPPEFGKRDTSLDKRFKSPDSKRNITLYLEESDQPEFTHELTLGVLNAVRKIDIQHRNPKYIKKSEEMLRELRESLPTIWTLEFARVLKERVLDDKRVINWGKPFIRDGVYQIEPELGGSLFDSRLKGSVGITYSTDKKLAGTASATVSNFGGINDQTSIEAKLGAEQGRASFNTNLPYPPYRSYNARLLDSSFFLKAAYNRDTEQQYEFVKADQELINAGIGYKWKWNNLDSTQKSMWGLTAHEDRKKSSFVTSIKSAVDYEDWHFREQNPAVPVLNGGQYGIAKLNFAEDMTFDFRDEKSRFQELNIPVLLEGQYGFSLDDDNDDYSQLRFSVQSKLYMRWRIEKDISINLRFGGGVSDDKTPVFKKFKVGNRDTVRGLESSEILANSYSLQSIEMAFSLRSILKPLLDDTAQGASGTEPNTHKSNSADTETEPSDKEILSDLLKQINLEVFYDRCSVSQDDRFSEMFRFDGSLQGYGININMEVPFQGIKAKLEFGYAYSPDSETHSSGLFYTRINTNIW